MVTTKYFDGSDHGDTRLNGKLEDVYCEKSVYTALYPEYFPKSLVSNLFTTGYNSYGQLADNTRVSKSSPINVGAMSDWKIVQDGSEYMIGIKADGTLWGWGYNSQYQLGLGSGNNASKSSPVQIGSFTDWKSVGVNMGYTLATKTNGTLWSWGTAYGGALGLGAGVEVVNGPSQIGSLNTWASVHEGQAQYNSMAIKTDGTLWGWGANNWGTLGLGNNNQYFSPMQVGTLTNWKQVACAYAYAAAAVKTDGTLWIWGKNASGGQVSSPVQVGSLTNWKQITVGGTTSTQAMVYLAVKTDGTLWGWGLGHVGIGDGATLYTSPVQIGALTNWSKVYNGRICAFAIKTDGTLWAWGNNANGQLGLGDTTTRLSPVQVGTKNDWIHVSSYGYESAMLRSLTP